MDGPIRSTTTRLQATAAALALAATVVASGCSGGSGTATRTPPATVNTSGYYTLAAAAIASLDKDVSVYGAHIQTTDDPEFSKSYAAYAIRVAAFAAEFAALSPPDGAEGAHKTMVESATTIAAATKQIAEAASPGHAPTQQEIDLAVKQARAVNAWATACRTLQDRASGAKAGVQLVCTALHQRETPGL